MTKNELLAKVQKSIDDSFANSDSYFDAKSDAIAAYDEYIKKHPEEDPFAALTDFINEHVMKNAAKISAETVISVLSETGVITLDE